MTVWFAIIIFLGSVKDVLFILWTNGSQKMYTRTSAVPRCTYSRIWGVRKTPWKHPRKRMFRYVQVHCKNLLLISSGKTRCDDLYLKVTLPEESKCDNKILVVSATDKPNFSWVLLANPPPNYVGLRRAQSWSRRFIFEFKSKFCAYSNAAQQPHTSINTFRCRFANHSVSLEYNSQVWSKIIIKSIVPKAGSSTLLNHFT